MGILDRYLIKRLTEYHCMAAFALSVLFGLFVFSDQIDDIGKGKYGIFDATKYVVMTAPDRLLTLMPVVSLLATLLALFHITSTSELIAMLTSGYNPQKIFNAVLIVTSLMVAFVVMCTQWVIPSWSQEAELQRMVKTSELGILTTDKGFWTRKDNTFVHIGRFLPGFIPSDISIYEFTATGQLQKHIKAMGVDLQEDHYWLLKKVVVRTFSDSQISYEELDDLLWYPIEEQIEEHLLTLPPTSLSYSDLYKHIDVLQKKKEYSHRYELILWQKIATPFTMFVMAILAIPMGFFLPRGNGGNIRIALGVSMGIGFFLFNKIIFNVSLFFSISPLIAICLPVALIGIFALVQVNRIKESIVQ